MIEFPKTNAVIDIVYSYGRNLWFLSILNCEMRLSVFGKFYYEINLKVLFPCIPTPKMRFVFREFKNLHCILTQNI